MKRKAEIQEAYDECIITTQEMELFDGEPDLYIAQGWQEALLWVLGRTTYQSYGKEAYKDCRVNGQNSKEI